MDNDMLVSMMYHIDMQCEIVLLSSEALDETIARYDREMADMVAAAAAGSEEVKFVVSRATSVAYWHLQSLLVAAGNVSMALWGQDPRGSAIEREPLRRALGVTDQSVLFGREVRNCFEHYDERVAQWIVDNPGMPFSDCNIGPWFPPNKTFRHYNPITKIVTGVDRKYKQHELSITEVVEEVRRINAVNPCAYRPPLPRIDDQHIAGA